MFVGRIVTVVMDCSAPGRAAAARIAGELTDAGATVISLDLSPERDDGYDLTDWLAAHSDAGDALMRTFAEVVRTGPWKPAHGLHVERVTRRSHSD